MRIKEKLFQLINEMNLNDKALVLTTNNDAKMIRCGNLMLYKLEETCEHCDFHHYRCAVHILNLAVNHGMVLRAPIIDKVRNTFLMLEKFKHMHEELNYPMYKATKMLSSSSYPTVSDIWLTFIGIFRHIELYIENQNHSIEKCMMADSICKKLEDYWTIIDKSTIISTLLDPCSKLLTFSIEEKRNQAINMLCSKMNNYTSKLNNSNSKNNILKSSSTRLFFENLITQQNNQVNQAQP
ncbi:9985_t:CDS:2 [Entrophospora sp. SA101]|nr:22142_t:CDS:2 [Entrophospora sp. SA101]CAJ0760984.1 9985_t:CDS:2 [Entrophospora sp. SA101]